jgi:phage terminase Nu1 subunit (DNA packaging protein)
LKPTTIAELAILTGRDVRTVARQLGDAGIVALGRKGRAVLYDSELSLRAIYKVGGSTKDRLDSARAEIAEIDLAERRGEVLATTSVLAIWQKRVLAFRARMLALPSKIAGQFAPPGKLQQAEDSIRAAIYEALNELAGVDEGDRGSSGRGVPKRKTSSPADRVSVG